ncbi:hypothetical protein K435DRAFT_872055 [Dendrothele bispora CBS 962.96]|uniref:Reverse transcriptase domain-containing protein n=1 Tax=Dendrothele bispora (strain CBS 962.96) TaxID=1314807 RepID=A0A4S8L2J6_DENBC|nr:hypothetical protein K435DRAFT_872055 [Dendrothele bispora CBS 962.96]
MSSILTRRSDSEYPTDATSSYLTPASSKISTSPGSPTQSHHLTSLVPAVHLPNDDTDSLIVTSAVDGTKTGAQIPPKPVDLSMSALSAGQATMPRRNVRMVQEEKESEVGAERYLEDANDEAPSDIIEVDDMYTGLEEELNRFGNERSKSLLRRPAFLRGLVWSDDEVEGKRQKLTLAEATEFMEPLPRVPDNEILNITALIVRAWPWANTDNSEAPATLDRSYPLRDPVHIKFACKQRDKEIAVGRFSDGFPQLLPGMQSVPIVVVPKPNGIDLRMTVHHSAGPFPINSFIPKEKVRVPLDNLHDLGAALLRYRKKHGRHVKLVVWKSDVSQAYRRVPMDPRWQMKQVVRVDDAFHVDRCNNFGNRGAGGLWGALMGLVAWIARFIKLLEDIFTYADDNFGADEEENMIWYEKYEQRMPEKQVRLLQLWDELGIPHEKEKQLFGLILVIIGFEVDPNAMTITMPLSSKSDLINAIVIFAQYKQRRTLREYQQIGGWCNWALNVYPLLRPGLSQLYHD